MTPPPLPLIDGCLFIDNSTIELLTTCPRAMEYSYLWKRVLNAERSALSFGTAVHLAMDYRYRNCPSWAERTDRHEQELDAALVKHFEENPTPIDDHRTLEHCRNLVRGYNERHLIEPFKVLAMPCRTCKGTGSVEDSVNPLCPTCKGSTQEPMVEMPFAVKLVELQCLDTFLIVYYSGRIDLVVEWDGRTYPVDHKTTSMMGTSFGEEMHMSPQAEGYAWALKQVTGIEPPGYVINALRTLKCSERTAANPQLLKKWQDENYQRFRVYMEPTRLDEWKRNVIALVEEFLWHYSRSYMPMKKKWCVGKYGRCQYYDVCTLPPHNRETMLKSNIFKDNDWSPLNQTNH